MRSDFKHRFITRFIAGGVAAVLILLSPGLPAYAAMGRAVAPVTVNPAISPAGIGGAAAGLSLKAGLFPVHGGMSVSLNSALPSASFGRPGIFSVQNITAQNVADVGVGTPPTIGFASRHSAGKITNIAVAVPAAVPGLVQVNRAANKSVTTRALYPAAKAKTSKKTIAGRLFAAAAGIPRLLGFSGATLKSAAGRTFDSSARRDAADLSPAVAGIGRGQAGISASKLAAGGTLKAADKADPSVADFSGRTEDKPAPKQKVSRALRIGALTAIIMLALDMAVMAAAVSMGYTFHPSYEMPALADPAAFSALGATLAIVLAKVQALFSAAWVAPLNEEVYFRAGLVGLAGYGALRTTRTVVRRLEKIRAKFSWMRSWIVPVGFGLAATEAAMFFALLHEMSDPILITIRILQALLFSYLYVKEGLVAGIAHHAAFNALAVLTLPLVYGAGMTVLAGNSFIVAAVLAAGAFMLWRLTRSTARKEAGEMQAGRLAPYRLSIKGSRRLARAGWASVAILIGLAVIQPAGVGALMMGSMAAQLAPAAMALGAYAFLLGNLKRREGAAAVAKIRNPAPLSLGNRVGAWVGGVFGALYLGFIGGSFLIRGATAALPLAAWGLPMTACVAAALPLAIWAVLTVIRIKAGKKGISPWLYLSQYFFGTVAAVTAAMPWLLPLLQRAADVAAGSGLSGGMILPTLMSTLWTIPVFIGLAAVMTAVGRAMLRPASPVNHVMGAGYRLKRSALAFAAGVLVAFSHVPLLGRAVPYVKDHLSTLSAPRMSEADRRAIVDYYRRNKPKLVLMDWDNTFVDNKDLLNKVASADRVAILADLKKAGIRTGFVTNRPLKGDGYGMEWVLLKEMPAALRGNFFFSTGGGAEVWEMNEDGSIPEKPTRGVHVITDEDRETIREIVRVAAEKNGYKIDEGDYFEQYGRSYEYAMILDNAAKRDGFAAFYADFEAAYNAAGFAEKYAAKLKVPTNDKHLPYIRIRALGAAKVEGVKAILQLLEEQGAPVAENEVVYFGDEFAAGEDDVSGVQGIKKGLGLAVGSHLDPAQTHVHLLPGVGSDNTVAFLRDIISEAPKAEIKAAASNRAPKAWLSKRYKPILEAGILIGFSLGAMGFFGALALANSGIIASALLSKTVGGLAAVSLVGGVLAGTLVGDRIARGSVEAVIKRYQARIMDLSGVEGVGVTKTADGRKAIGVYYADEASLKFNQLALPELIDGYETIPTVREAAELPSLDIEGRSLKTEADFVTGFFQ